MTKKESPKSAKDVEPVTEPETPPPSRGWLAELQLAVAFLTRQPFYKGETVEQGALAASMRWFPVVGSLIGFLGGLTFVVCISIGLPPLAAALITLVVMIWGTGALHEDGLADMADGFGGGHTKEDKLTIMHHSQAGSYGIIAVIFSIALRASALMVMPDTNMVIGALIVAAALSRASMPVMMRLLEPAREDGLAVSSGRASERVAMTAGGIAIAIALVLQGITLGLAAVAITGLVIFVIVRLARNQIGGYTGDVLGATGVSVETLVLLTLAATP